MLDKDKLRLSWSSSISSSSKLETGSLGIGSFSWRKRLILARRSTSSYLGRPRPRPRRKDMFIIESDVLIEVFVVKEVNAKLVLEVVVDCAIVGSQLVEKIGCGLTGRIHHGVLAVCDVHLCTI